LERLIGLTEMFPEKFRTVASKIGSASWEGSKWLYHAGQVGVWVFASSATILALPVMFESERNQMEEQQIQQQRQVSANVCHSDVYKKQLQSCFRWNIRQVID